VKTLPICIKEGRGIAKVGGKEKLALNPKDEGTGQYLYLERNSKISRDLREDLKILKHKGPRTWQKSEFKSGRKGLFFGHYNLGQARTWSKKNANSRRRGKRKHKNLKKKIGRSRETNRRVPASAKRCPVEREVMLAMMEVFGWE